MRFLVHMCNLAGILGVSNSYTLQNGPRVPPHPTLAHHPSFSSSCTGEGESYWHESFCPGKQWVQYSLRPSAMHWKKYKTFLAPSQRESPENIIFGTIFRINTKQWDIVHIGNFYSAWVIQQLYKLYVHWLVQNVSLYKIKLDSNENFQSCARKCFSLYDCWCSFTVCIVWHK